ncbi:MAG TPA: hypothetical protein PLP18_06750 [Smithellaceae bacterium]|nr:hypothetical protein [Smithellaceae bacterium]HPE07497.1 hypothetical protein [Smithellaceae bacterium]
MVRSNHIARKTRHLCAASWGTMGSVEVLTAKPRRIGNLAGYFHFLHPVLIAALNPFINAEIVIEL